MCCFRKNRPVDASGAPSNLSLLHAVRLPVCYTPLLDRGDILQLSVIAIYLQHGPCAGQQRSYKGQASKAIAMTCLGYEEGARPVGISVKMTAEISVRRIACGCLCLDLKGFKATERPRGLFHLHVELFMVSYV